MIVVLGSGGLLGSWICAKYPKETIGYSHKELDITDRVAIKNVLSEHRPDAVINCTGIVKMRSDEQALMWEINAKAPRTLAMICDDVGTKLVQVSTDCVFSGSRGLYHEYDFPDAKDIYGVSKKAGEIIWEPHLTVRTSFIGWPDPTMRGLLAVLRTSSNIHFPGYVNRMWNGMTTWAVADYLIEYAYSRVSGVVHVFGQTVSKYELLKTYIEVFDLVKYGYKIIPEIVEPVNRTLSSGRQDRIHIPGTINLEESMRGMRSWEKKFQESRL